jgi:hypothetical protein
MGINSPFFFFANLRINMMPLEVCPFS